MLKTFRRFLGDRSGNFAIMTGLLLPLVLVAGGAAVDFGIALSSSQRLGAAANGAVLAALSEVQARATDATPVTEAMINGYVREFFLAESANIPFTTLTSVTPVSKIDRNEISTSLSFRADYDTSIMSVFGKDTVLIADQARATVTLRSYININILVDTSQSMGIGATNKDQQLVAQATSPSCAFACHDQARGNASYEQARRLGANMRIDVARSAVANALDTMFAAEEFNGQVTVGLYRFSNELTEILSPTNARSGDLAYAKSLANSQIGLELNYGGTNQERALQQINAKIPFNGSGKSSIDRLQYVIVITDGVESGQAWLSGRNWFRHERAQPNSPSRAYEPHEVNYALKGTACDALVAKGVKVYFIYTEYLEPKYGTISNHDRNRFDFISKSLFPIIPSRMTECTRSASQVLKANTPTEIHDAFEELARRLSSPLRLY